MSHPETFGLTKGQATGKDLLLDIHLEDHKNTGKPCVVFACFIPEQERIARQIAAKGMTVELLNGGTSNAKRTQIDNDFRSGKLQWIVGSPQVAAVGFNWGHLDHMIFSSLDYGDDTFYQAYRRGIRGARTTPLRISILEYENSIDQRMMAIINRKSKLANDVNPHKEIFDLSAA